MPRFSDDSKRVLYEAGWVPGRQVDISPWMETMLASGISDHESARRFLAEFGGLTVDISGPGIDKSREPFEFDPMQCLGEEDRFIEWGTDLGRDIFPIGILDMGRFFLGIDEEGEIYLVETWLGSFGKIPEALENLIKGVRPKIVLAELEERRDGKIMVHWISKEEWSQSIEAIQSGGCALS